jgi:tetratricopeptide (TPR) repeat protein
MGLVACEKEKADTPTDQGRDIYYTVSDGSSVSGFSGTTAHINTNDEFDALLDRFCDYTQNGEQVMFCGSHPASHTKASSSDTPTSITTTDREELKVWMKEMEKAGKTVQITYNEDNGTWSGRAYANLGQNDKAIDYLLKAAKKADNNSLSPNYLIQAGELYEAQGKPQKALDCYREVKTKYINSMAYQDIDRYIERVK